MPAKITRKCQSCGFVMEYSPDDKVPEVLEHCHKCPAPKDATSKKTRKPRMASKYALLMEVDPNDTRTAADPLYCISVEGASPADCWKQALSKKIAGTHRVVCWRGKARTIGEQMTFGFLE